MAQQGIPGDREPAAQEDCPDPHHLRYDRLLGRRYLGHSAAPAGISGVVVIFIESTESLSFFLF